MYLHEMLLVFLEDDILLEIQVFTTSLELAIF